jgi:hypothetical protein
MSPDWGIAAPRSSYPPRPPRALPLAALNLGHGYLPSALVAIAIIPRNPPTDDPVNASTMMA